MRRPLLPHLEMLLVVLFWGGNFTASKLTLLSIPPLGFTAIRFTTGSLFMWLLIRRTEPGSLPQPGMLRRLVVLGLVGNTLYQLCFILGLSRTSATNTALILSAMPPVVTVAAGLLGMEVISNRQRMALALAMMGVLTVIASRGLDLAHGDWRGDLLILGAVACWTAYTLGLRRLAGRMSALRLTGWTMITGTPGLVLMGLPSLSALRWSTVPWQAWAGLAYSTLLSLLAAYILWSRAVQRLGASRAALYTCVVPLIATLVAMAVLGERPGPAHFMGGTLIVGGVLLGNLQAARRAQPGGDSREP
jgi:drug/metabolite transporter (DMT)-like permease